MASVVGKPIKVVQNTLRVQRGRFARMCVEINLSKPVVGKIWMRDHWYRVEYEGLHLICAKCGCYGHMTRDCSGSAATIPPKNHQATHDNALQVQEFVKVPLCNEDPSEMPQSGSAMAFTPHVS